MDSHKTRSDLRSQLNTHGQSAIAMLKGDSPIEAKALLSALKAVTLLDSVTCGTDLKVLHQNLWVAANDSSKLNDFVDQNVDIQCQTLLRELSGDAQKNGLFQLVELAGLCHLLTGPTKERLNIELEEAVSDILVNPQTYASLANFAEELANNLDLDEGHPVQDLLADFSKADRLVSPLPTQAEATSMVAQAISKTKTQEQKASLLTDLHAWAEKLKGKFPAFAEKLLGVANSPVLAADRGDRIQDFFESVYIDIPRVRTQMRFEKGRLLFIVSGDAGDLPEKVTYGKRHIKCDSFTEHEDGDCEKIWELKNHQMKAIRLTWEDGESYDCVFE